MEIGSPPERETMPAVCLYFQVHQPYRLNRYSYFDIGSDKEYFDTELNRSIIQKVSERCYVPTNRHLLQLIRRYEGAFKVTFSITGTAVEQMKRWAPEALSSFQELAATGCVDFLGETYYHSLAALYDKDEWCEQVGLHSEMMAREFGVRPTVFRNTELLYSDEIGRAAAALGFSGILAEGIDDVLGWRSPNFVYRVPETETKVLLRNHKLSDEIGFRFVSHKDGDGRSLTAKRYASWIHSLTGNADLVGLFLDYETFGEHLGKDTGIFEFLNDLPASVLAHQDWRFSTAGEAAEHLQASSELSFPRLTSWADISRDDSTWRGNRMQNSSLLRTYDRSEFSGQVDCVQESTRSMVETWRRLQTSDHYYYMSTKGGGDGVVHQYFSPFESPYDAFISFSNVMKDFTRRCRECQVMEPLPVVGRVEEVSGIYQGGEK